MGSMMFVEFIGANGPLPVFYITWTKLFQFY